MFRRLFKLLFLLFLIVARKTEDGSENAASQSIAAVIMMIFQYSNNPGLPIFHVKNSKIVSTFLRFFSASLPTVGMPDGIETGRCEGHSMRGCLRHSACQSLGRQIALLLLAFLQSKPIRSQGCSGQIRKCALFSTSTSTRSLINTKPSYRICHTTYSIM